jgi:CRISPR-associated protein Csb1
MAGYEKGVPLNWNKIAETCSSTTQTRFSTGRYGQLEDGRVKVQRAITGFIEAEGVREVASVVSRTTRWIPPVRSEL